MKRLSVLLLATLAGSALAQGPDYGGPTILSRGVGPVLLGGGDFARIRPYLAINGVYDNQLTPVSVDSKGEIPSSNLYGGEASVGVLGYHSWRRTVLGLDYRGNYRHYSRESYFDGTDHTLSLGVTHQSSRRVNLSFRQSAGTYSRDYAPLSAGGFYSPQFADVPTNELFDSRVFYFSTMGDLTFYKSPRLSFNIGGSGMGVRRRSRQLVGVTGGTARGDIAYQLGPSSAIGVDYGYTHYSFTNAFGSSDIHRVSFNYAARLGRRWHFGIRVGAGRIESLGLRRVGLNPLVAAITGQTTGVEVFYRVNYLPQGSASLSRSFERSTVSLSYDIGAGYGNGVYLTSQQQSAQLSYSTTARQRWNFGLNAGFDAYSSLSQQLGKYYSYRGGTGVTCQIARSVHFISRFDARQYEVNATTFKRTTYRASVGFAFSPGEFPLSLW